MIVAVLGRRSNQNATASTPDFHDCIVALSFVGSARRASSPLARAQWTRTLALQKGSDDLQPIISRDLPGAYHSYETWMQSKRPAFAQTKRAILDQYFDAEIQLDPSVVSDVLDDILAHSGRVLIFGLGYDSKMWYQAAGGNRITFIENDPEYVALNGDLNRSSIVLFDYDSIDVGTSFGMLEEKTIQYSLPPSVLAGAPYDVILIDGPPGYRAELPGRYLPIFWSSRSLSHPGTLVYVDDVDRKLEADAVHRYLMPAASLVKYYPSRGGAAKFLCR